MTTTPLLDLAQGEARKAAGMEMAAEARASLLEYAQHVARLLAVRGPITADDVIAFLAPTYGEAALGPAAGSIFRGKHWEFTGEWRKSERKTNHARMIRVWRLKGGV